MTTVIGKDIHEAARVLKNGGLVAIPTETVYGLAANAMDEAAVTKVFTAKNRPSFDPLIVHIYGFEQVTDFLKHPLPKSVSALANEFWPGPLSIILKKKKEGFSDLITAGQPTVALRTPNHPLTLRLLHTLSFPLVAPSANPFGYVSPTRPSHVLQQLEGKVDYILDGGPTDIGLESTIVDLSQNPPLLRRKGGIPLEKLQQILPNLTVADYSSSNPAAPGMLKSHYSTHIRIVYYSDKEQWSNVSKEHIGGIFFNQYKPDIPQQNQLLLSPSGSLEEAAKNLFAHMRQQDLKNFDVLVVETVPDHGIGMAINDKLKRATADR